MKTNKSIALMIGMLSLMFILGCASADTTASSSTATINGFSTQGALVSKKTGNFETFVVDSDYSVSNNMWGLGSNGRGSACTFTENIDGKNAFGWSWNVKGTNVVIYPEVGYGWSPNAAALWAGNPIIPRISEGKNITVDFTVKSQYSNDSTWNLAFDLWLSGSVHPTSTKPGYEIMVWLDHNKQGPWANGTPPSRVTIDGVSYDAYTNVGSDGGWIVLSYVNVGPDVYDKTGFNLSSIINDAVTRFGVPTSDYVNAIEFGNEVVSGSGMTEISRWKIKIQ